MPPLLKRDLTKEDCEKWKAAKKKNPSNPKNPISNYKVSSKSAIYEELNAKCAVFDTSSTPSPNISYVKLPLKDMITKEKCEVWIKNKEADPLKPKNPITNYRISPKSVIYKELDKYCLELFDIGKKQKPVQNPSPKSNKSSTSLLSDQSPKPKSNKSNKLLSRKLNLEDCLKWTKNKMKNPISNYTLSEKSDKLKEIKRQCEPLLQPQNKIVTKETSPTDSIHIPEPIIKIEPRHSPKKDVNESHLYYPDLEDEHFSERLSQLQEYYLYKQPEYDVIRSKEDFEVTANKLCGEFEKTLYQYFVSHYISARTPYRSLLLYHGVGVGKTCSAITIAEGFLVSHSAYEEPKIWVVMPLALKNSFKEQIFSLQNLDNYDFLANQCTGDLYIKLAQLLRDTRDTRDKEKAQTKIKKLIKSRYRLFTYDSFASFIETEYIQKNRIVKDKVIIVDEAHNIRTMASGNGNTNDTTLTGATVSGEKRVYTALTTTLEKGVNNRLVLLSATPMYNKPEDIYDLLYLLLLNDKRTIPQPFPSFFNDKGVINPKAVGIIRQLAGNYISYLKGKNPFTFALKLSPKYSPNIKFLTNEFDKDSNGKKIQPQYKNWLSKVEEGIVISKLGSKQSEYISRHIENDDNNVFNNLQPMNIVYQDCVGEKGFNTFYTRHSDNKGSLYVKYNRNYVNAMYPDEEHLGKYSGKFLNICNILKNTKGVVVIYSGYIWSGIIPMACALEHMGFQREGTNNIIQNPEIIPDAPKYGFARHPKYCILSSDNSDVMGSSSIDNLLKIINSPKNIDGSQIKVILITPVAGEGLSFFNIREMHLLEPWFHFNRVTQIIGRGIRNCRHQHLPLEERNVTVFMHASYDNDKQETTDIHAFRIAANKMIQSDAVEKLIRDNAVDCTLMKNINYFPKSLFELGKLKIRTSQNIAIDHEYGDDASLEPQCKNVSVDMKKLDIRKETYAHFIPALQIKLRRVILNTIHQGDRYITYDDIIDAIGFNKEIVYQSINASIYPNTLIDGYILIPHENGLHIISVRPQVTRKLRIIHNKEEEQKPEVPKKCNQGKLASISKKELHDATVALYLYLDSICFEDMAKQFIQSNELSETDEAIAKLLYAQGALIAKSELRSIRDHMSSSKYIGYVNIFNQKFEPIVYVNGKYRDLIEREEAELIGRRRQVVRPTSMAQENAAWGMIVPILNKKTNTYSNVFKLLTAGSSAGLKTGIVCTSLQKGAQDTILRQIGIPNDSNATKVDTCNYIASELLKINRMTLYPEYKPI